MFSIEHLVLVFNTSLTFQIVSIATGTLNMVKCEDKIDGLRNNAEKADCSDDEQENILIYRAEIYRLESFKHWPCQSIVQKEDLARNGFYYLGEGDRVQCVFCNVVLSSWEKGDNVITEHRRHSKNCLFVLGKKTTNIPYSPSTDSLSDLQPAFPEFQDYTRRLESYGNFWPKAMKQRPKELAAAGLFYTGREAMLFIMTVIMSVQFLNQLQLSGRAQKHPSK